MTDGHQTLAALHDNSHHQHLHPFCLPPPLISSLVPHHHDLSGAPALPQPVPLPPSPTDQLAPHGALQNFSCTICEVEFTTPESQRAHCKSDWHRLNLKLKASSSELTVKEDQFQAMVERLEHSLSGSGLSSSEHESDSDPDPADSRFNELLVRSTRRSAPRPSSEDEEDDESALGGSPKGPLVWFAVSDDAYRDPSGTRVRFGFYRCIFPATFVDDGRATGPTELGERYLAELAQLQQVPAPLGAPADPVQLGFPTWTMLMVAGGHFAGMVVSVVPKLRHVAKNRPPELEPVILHSKTFHRYTTRRKQGGGQATHDGGGKGAAKSAGANLRRYNEQSLTQDIRSTLATWSSSLNASSLIFIRSSKSNLKIFFEGNLSSTTDDCSFKLDRQDPRIRSLPFVTKRPTLNELKRCFDELTRVKVVRVAKADLERLEAEAEAVRQKAQQRLDARQARLAQQAARVQASSAAAPAVVVDRQQELELGRWTRVVDLVKKGKLDALREFAAKYHQADWFGRVPAEAGGGFESLLQIAAAEEQAEMVEALLVKWHCDPTVRGGAGGRGGLAAYELAGTRATRNAFRRAMARFPERWDWTGEAKVPCGLTEEMEAQQAAKGKERKQRLKDKVRERERARAQADEAARLQAEESERMRKADEERIRSEHSTQTVNRLGGGSARKTVVKSADNILGLSEEQRIKLERERRARAAEARLK